MDADNVVWSLEYPYGFDMFYFDLVMLLGPLDPLNSPPGQNGRHFTDDIFRCICVVYFD